MSVSGKLKNKKVDVPFQKNKYKKQFTTKNPQKNSMCHFEKKKYKQIYNKNIFDVSSQKNKYTKNTAIKSPKNIFDVPFRIKKGTKIPKNDVPFRLKKKSAKKYKKIITSPFFVYSRKGIYVPMGVYPVSVCVHVCVLYAWTSAD